MLEPLEYSEGFDDIFLVEIEGDGFKVTPIASESQPDELVPKSH